MKVKIIYLLGPDMLYFYFYFLFIKNIKKRSKDYNKIIKKNQ